MVALMGVGLLHVMVLVGVLSVMVVFSRVESDIMLHTQGGRTKT